MGPRMTTAEQRLAALDAANANRFARAKLRKRVEAGEVAAWKVIEDPPPFVLTTTVFDYMTWLPNVGNSRGSIAFKLLRQARVPSHTRIGAVTEAPRARLREAIHDYAHPARAAAFKARDRRAMRGANATHPAERGLSLIPRRS